MSSALQSINSETGREKSAFITLVGRPNVGKSSLMNRILGQKISIVSDKPQTTRTRIMGILTCGETQLAFIDTPGFHKPRNRLGENMVKAVGDGMTGVDTAVFVADAAPDFKFNAASLPPAELELLKTISARGLRCILVLNKIDLLEDKTALLEMIAAYSAHCAFYAVVPLSARTGDGVDILVDELLQLATPAPHYFSDDMSTDQSDEAMVCEIIREKLLRTLQKEVPHGIAVALERFFERDSASGDPILEVDATVFCEKESHKRIIIGRGGEMLKRVGSLARADIERFYGIRASVKLWVKVKEDWRNREGLIHTFGLD